MSGRPGSNWPPIAWKAIALPNELLPLVNLIRLRRRKFGNVRKHFVFSIIRFQILVKELFPEVTIFKFSN
jgi:hypothetical protein